jgi:hypothetical protein
MAMYVHTSCSSNSSIGNELAGTGDIFRRNICSLFADSHFDNRGAPMEIQPRSYTGIAIRNA